MKNRTRYYHSFDDEFEQSKNQDFKLKKDYKWIRTDLFSRLMSVITYTAAFLFACVYCPLFLHLKIRGRKNLKNVKGGFFIYANHTQPIGDVVIPALCVFPRRIYTVVSPANYGIPVIGRLLPYLGALSTLPTADGIKNLSRAIEYRIAHKNPVVIYPEARVWEYYTGIRPFTDSSFKFPAKLGAPCFAMTRTYKKSKIFKRPVTEVYLDGPFYSKAGSVRESASILHSRVRGAMEYRSESSNCEYIKYIKI